MAGDFILITTTQPKSWKEQGIWVNQSNTKEEGDPVPDALHKNASTLGL